MSARMPHNGRNEARRTLDTSISEKDLQDAVIAYMRQVGWLVAHFRPARTMRGWRTRSLADGEGSRIRAPSAIVNS